MRASVLIALFVLALPRQAQADEPKQRGVSVGSMELSFFPGPSRAIPHYMSASRDTAVLSIQLLPFRSVAAGVDFALLALLGKEWEERLGLFGLIELHSACEFGCEDVDVNPSLWRGLMGGSLAISNKRWGEALFGEGGKIELTGSVRHESEHASIGGSYPAALTDVTMGDFVMPDLAVRIPVSGWDFELRAQTKVFLPSSRMSSLAEESIPIHYVWGQGFDAIARWRLHELAHPFASAFFEYIEGASSNVKINSRDEVARVTVPDQYLLRAQLGSILQFPIGDLQMFTFAELGHGEGVRKFHEEFRWGLGLRGVLIR